MLAAELNVDKTSSSADKVGGGIDIEETKRMLKNEDEYDKKLYRERIKRLHKEKKLKEKSVRRAKRFKVNDLFFLLLFYCTHFMLNSNKI